MIQVKICGITSIEDAMCAARNGAAAVGFIFYQSSPRYITPQAARRIIDLLPANLVKVGVFVNEGAAEVKRIFSYCSLDMLQLHGNESPGYCRHFPADRIIKALELKCAEDLKTSALFEVAAILADSRHGGLYGGTGRKSNWDLACLLQQPLILSGGLNDGNVVDALRSVKPAALDINSGVEERPGKKDSLKIARIMEMIKAVDIPGRQPIIFVRREKK
jgi:phosphoribosylanthranilate isomerase